MARGVILVHNQRLAHRERHPGFRYGTVVGHPSIRIDDEQLAVDQLIDVDGKGLPVKRASIQRGRSRLPPIPKESDQGLDAIPMREIGFKPGFLQGRIDTTYL